MTTDEVPGVNRTGLRFEKILMTVEQDLRSSLERARLESDHSLTIGEQAEAAVRAALRGYLPTGFGMGHGFVYDAYGDGSRQTDLIIANPDHPLSFPDDKAGTYVVDGVSAAGEVKAVLDVKALDDCLAKGAAFKQLRMTINESDHVVTTRQQAFMNQMGLVPPYFVVAFDTTIAVGTMIKRLQRADLVPPPPGKALGEEDAASTPQPPLDAICVLGSGVCLNIRPDNPMGIRFTQPAGYHGWVFMPTPAPLAWTLAWLHATMPRILRGASVLSPYLLPPVRHIRYMADRGQREISDAREV